MSQQERTAASGDGRTFELVGGRATTAGDVLVVATAEAGSVIVQATEPTGGVVLGLLPEHDGSRLVTEVEPFEASPALDATEHELSLLQRATGADLPVGAWAAGNGGAPALLRSSGFNRHTFLCGQSGSGKTYALGVVLEQILLGTGLRMAILDPNADFVRLREPVPGADPAAAAAISAADIRVLGSVPPAEPLRMRFATMPRQAQAAVLQLDPLADRDEYNLFLHTFVPEPGSPTGDVASLVTGLLRGGEDERALAQRIENLGLPEWDVWALELPSASEIVSAGARVTVLDLAGFHDPRESSAVCLDLVESLWAERHQRTPTLIVIDEAHNLCPAEPSGSIQERLVERLVQIAAEGRKYGLWLLLSTQRPSKVHPQVLSQCDNLMLMRMNSPADVAEVAGIFGFAPPAMVAAAPYFRQGEAVMAGRFVPCPMRVRMGARLTVEGGSDVAVPEAGA